jgi:hypothetical protein
MINPKYKSRHLRFPPLPFPQRFNSMNDFFSGFSNREYIRPYSEAFSK